MERQRHRHLVDDMMRGQGMLRQHWPIILLAALVVAVLLAGMVDAHAAEDTVLEWDDVVGEDGYIVERKLEKCDDPTPSAPWLELNRTGADITTYTDPALAPGLKVCYRVAAFNEGGQSDYSNTAGKIVKPGAPGNLRIVQ